MKATELGRALKACRLHFALAALFSAGINLLYLAPPLFMMQVYDRVLNSGSEATLFYLILALFIALATLAVLDDVRAQALTRAGVRLDQRLAARVLSSLIDLGLSRRTPPRAQALRDLETLRQFVSSQGTHALFDAPWMPIYLLVLTLIHSWMGLFALAGTVVIVCLAAANEYATRVALLLGNEQSIRNHAAAEATLRNGEVIQAMGMQRGLMRRWRQNRAMALGLQIVAYDRNSFYSSLIKLLRLFLQSLMLGLGAWLAIERQISPGAMFAASILFGRAMAPVEQMIGAWRQFVGVREAYGRLGDLLRAVPPNPERMQLPDPEGALSLTRLIFAPQSADRAVIKGIDLSIGRGEAVGIIGPSAAGKSTLARLMVGVWRPSAGVVRLDDADVSQWDREQLGRHIGYLPQDVELFSGTVSDNIARFQETRADAVVQAANRAGIHDLILRLPDGYDTEIGEGGAILSAGQRQRIGLARALFGNPRLVVLDEPNSNLDIEGEQALTRAVSQLKADAATVIVITHRPSILVAVDRIIGLRDGTVEMDGPRGEILARIFPPPGRPAQAQSPTIVEPSKWSETRRPVEQA
ncbi:type I secretion system permease/ATPase [Skermanella mucosa]|uniref:type I secretion system permease/ATPase n=1 Tax=Skermanella mucosa TaxID=1789672 RepID=UPI00192BE249|nr:type I secretion system permease/ATPase [Skermanella mucosa]UEM22401.1 type I secretion system permease/ATPase [Skermanella mucosa]